MKSDQKNKSSRGPYTVGLYSILSFFCVSVGLSFVLTQRSLERQKMVQNQTLPALEALNLLFDESKNLSDVLVHAVATNDVYAIEDAEKLRSQLDTRVSVIKNLEVLEQTDLDSLQSMMSSNVEKGLRIAELVIENKGFAKMEPQLKDYIEQSRKVSAEADRLRSKIRSRYVSQINDAIASNESIIWSELALLAMSLIIAAKSLWYRKISKS